MEPHYVNFEQAKLLKELGFNIKSKFHYPNLSAKQEICQSQDWNTFTDMSGDSKYYTAPEQHQVVEWLRVNHGVWVQVSISRYGMFHCNIFQNQPTKDITTPMSFEMICQLNDFKTPHEAYSAAFDYILPTLTTL